ncbi:MAG: Cys-Xaa-Xaa-Xaa repeat radical SAM target protein [Bacteroidales bacterium]|nr:Cys-Xaa-Xaa-Xaa repeat radical SAM target protein [Bacteroidales bacterium]
MENNKKETQNRREFFKEAAKKALPILGAVALLANPVIARAAESEPMGCTGTCYQSCYGGCTGCQSNCDGGCSGGCSRSCSNSCALNCQASAGGKNTGCGDCRVYCYGSCSDTCSRHCNGSCVGGSYKVH